VQPRVQAPGPCCWLEPAGYRRGSDDAIRRRRDPDQYCTSGCTASTHETRDSHSDGNISMTANDCHVKTTGGASCPAFNIDEAWIARHRLTQHAEFECSCMIRFDTLIASSISINPRLAHCDGVALHSYSGKTHNFRQRRFGATFCVTVLDQGSSPTRYRRSRALITSPCALSGNQTNNAVMILLRLRSD
jgi:hypothetical protein